MINKNIPLLILDSLIRNISEIFYESYRYMYNNILLIWIIHYQISLVIQILILDLRFENTIKKKKKRIRIINVVRYFLYR